MQSLRLTSLQGHSHQLVAAMNFQNTDPAVAGGVDHPAPKMAVEAVIAARWCQPLGFGIAGLQPQLPKAAVAVVHEHRNRFIAGIAADRAGAAAVLVHPAAQVPAAGGQFAGGSRPGAAGHQGGAPAFIGALLLPVKNAIQQLGFFQAGGLAQCQRSGEGGRAGGHRSS